MNHTQQPGKKTKPTYEHGFLRVMFERFKRLPQKRLLFASIFLHLIFFTLLFFNWQYHEPIKPVHIPQNIAAHVVNADQVKAIQDKKIAEKERQNKKILDEKRKADLKKKQLQQKALEKKKAKEAALKKAAEQRKKEQEKKLKLKKEKEQKEKLEKEKRQKEKEALRKKEEERKRKEAELKKQRLEEERIEKQQQEKIKEQENKLFEKLQQLEQQKKIADENLRREQAFLEYELSEKERFTFLIRSKIENLWRKPPKSQNLKVVLRIRLLPNGELASVTVSESSGNAAFDNSAVLAARSVRRYPVPEDSKVFEQNFRQFSMSFSPEPL